MVFISNKYARWYYGIVNFRKLNPAVDSYTESHHIVPRSLGGTDDEDNLVSLTAREHYIVHRLLVKMTEGESRRKMAYACKMLMHSHSKHQQRHKVSSRTCQTIKLALNQILKGREFSDEAKAKMSASAKIRSAQESPEVKQRRSRQMTEMNKARAGVEKPYQRGDLNPFTNEDVKARIRQRNIEKYGYASVSHVPYTCEVCGHQGKGIAGYKRWHGANCRSLVAINIDNKDSSDATIVTLQTK